MSIEALYAAADALLAEGKDPVALVRAHVRPRHLRTLPVWQLALRALATGHYSAAGLARKIRVSPPAAYQAVSRLQSEGLISSAGLSSQTGRGPEATMWQITDAGQATLAKISASLEVEP